MVEKVLRYVEPVQPETQFEEILARFSENESLPAIPVVKNERPVGLISRYEFVDSLAQSSRSGRTGKDLVQGHDECGAIAGGKIHAPHELSGFLSESGIRHFTDGFIITEQGRYIGIGSGQDLLREITRAHKETARYANPLTSLPGNVPINEHIEYLLQSGKSFAVCHADLDNFKPYNDVCGYRKGDELIQFTAGCSAISAILCMISSAIPAATISSWYCKARIGSNVATGRSPLLRTLPRRCSTRIISRSAAI